MNSIKITRQIQKFRKKVKVKNDEIESSARRGGRIIKIIAFINII